LAERIHQPPDEAIPPLPGRGEARLCPATPYADRSEYDVVHVRDISRGGIGVLSGRPVQPDQCWQLQLIAQHLTMATLPAFCRFCRKVSDGAWLIGLEFGIEASVLLAMGVNSAELIHSDETPENQKLKGDFFPPEESARRGSP
jgi:hypothetical protein